MTKAKRFWSALLLVVIAGGCRLGSAGERPLPTLDAEVIRSGIYGSRDRPDSAARLITGAADLRRVVQRLENQMLGGGAVDLGSIDFKRYSVLLVEMGQRPTAGYALQFDRAASDVCRKTAVVVLNWIRPPPDGLQAQVITSPYVLIRLNTQAIEHISVRDQHDHLRFSIKLIRP